MGRSSPDDPGSETQIAQSDVEPGAALLRRSGRISRRRSKPHFSSDRSGIFLFRGRLLWLYEDEGLSRVIF